MSLKRGLIYYGKFQICDKLSVNAQKVGLVTLGFKQDFLEQIQTEFNLKRKVKVILDKNKATVQQKEARAG